MTGSSRELHQLFGLEPADPVQPGEVAVSVDAAACLVVFKLTSDAGELEVVLEPLAAYQIGFQLLDKAMRASRCSWAARA